MAVQSELTLGTAGSQLRDLARRLGVAGFWDWWLDQLASLVPAGPRAAWQRRRMRPVLAFDGARATLWRPVARNGTLAMEEHAAFPLDGDPAEVANAGRLALGTQGADSAVAVTLALPPRTVLRKQLALPIAVEENLRQVLGYDLDRHTPFKSDELYFDARTVGRDATRGMLSVDLAAARRSQVDPLLRHAESWGAAVAAISADPPALSSSSSLNLLPPEMRNGRAPWRRWQFWLPIVLLALFAIAATVLPLWQKREQAIALLHDAEAARAQAAVSEALRADLDRQVADYNFALERKFAFAPTVQVLEEVTHILPDDTWLTQLEVRSSRTKDTQRELNLRGESANAGRLVSLLEDSKLFTQAAPRSPTTKIQPGPGEIFDVGAQLKPLGRPEGEPLVIASAPKASAPRPPASSPAPATPAPAKPPAPAGKATPLPAPPAAATPAAPPTTAPPPATATPPPAAMPAEGNEADAEPGAPSEAPAPVPATSNEAPAPAASEPRANARPSGAPSARPFTRYKIKVPGATQ
ncbi:MAG TPA: PilN domain-containing protein [Casimicrobiaceae bacterium]|jgi:general secretion pathway protein L